MTPHICTERSARYRNTVLLAVLVLLSGDRVAVAQNSFYSPTIPYLASSIASAASAEGPSISPYLLQRANIGSMAAEAAAAVVNGSIFGGGGGLPSYAATSPSNAASPGETDSNGLLVYRPAGNTTLDPTDFENFFVQSYANASVKGITLVPGSYVVNATTQSFHLNLYCFNRPSGAPFELNFLNVTLYFANYMDGGIGFFFCQNFYFHGPFNFMYTQAALPFSQGTINSIMPIDGSNAQYTVTTDAGYPTVTTGLGDGQGHLCVAYQTNGVLVPNATDIYTQPATMVGDRRYTFTAPIVPNVRAGQRLAIRGNVGNHGIFIYKNVNSRFSYLNIYTAPIFGILDYYSTNTTISNNIIQPWPYRINSTFPLLSTNADGIHSLGARNIGPTVVSNQVINAGDDAFALHGVYYTVYAVDAARNTLTIFNSGCNNDFCRLFQLGDQVAVYSTPYTTQGTSLTPLPGAFTSLGGSIITNYTLLNTDPNVHPGYPFAGDAGGSVYPTVNYNSGYYVNLTLSTFPNSLRQASKDSLITDVTASGNNFRVDSNLAYNNRARGIFVKASNGSIRSNVVVGTSLFGLLLIPDLYFLEGDFLRNVTIASNTISTLFPNAYQTLTNPAGNGVLIVQNNQNLTYTNNVFHGAGTYAAAMSSTARLNVSSNYIANAGCYPSVNGLYTPFVPPRTLVYIAQSSRTTVRGNTFATNQNCNNKYGNYASPYTFVNVTS